MKIEGGITIGAGITIKNDVVAVSMRSLLSASGKTAYDAAGANNWFSVSAADYAAAVSGMSGVNKYCMSDVQMSAGNTAWSGGYAQAYNTTLNGSVPNGTYIIGFVCQLYSTTGTATPLISTTLAPSGSYSAIAPAATVSTAGSLQYFLRRAGTATAATSYLGLVMSQNGTQTATSGQLWYSTSGPLYTSWTNYNGGYALKYQVLGTSSYQWT